MKILFVMFFCISLLYGVEKDQNRQNTSEQLIQLNIKDVKSFDFLLFEEEYFLELRYCIGTSICFFKPNKELDLQESVKKITKYGKANIYKPYKLKVY